MTKRTSESGWAIPDDWDGETWACWQVQFPDSPKYERLLRSLLYSLSRGRSWDKFTGNLIDASMIGLDIFNANEPLAECEVCEDCAECPECEDCTAARAGKMGGAIIESEEDMGDVVTNVTFEDGILRVYHGHCCYDEFDLSGLATDPGYQVGDDPLVPDGGSAPTYYACGKAWAIVRAVRSVMDVTYTALSAVVYPWQYLGYIESEVGFNLVDKWVAAITVDWLGIGLAVDPDQAFSNNDQADVACRLANYFSDDAVGVPDGDAYDAVYNIFDGSNFVYDGLIKTAVRCLGKSNLDAIAKMGAADSEAVCCQAEITDPTPYWDVDWSYFIDLTKDLPSIITDDETTNEWLYGSGMTEVCEASGLSKIYLKIEVQATGGTFTHCWMLVDMINAFDYVHARFPGCTDQSDPDWKDTDPSTTEGQVFGITTDSTAVGSVGTTFDWWLEGYNPTGRRTSALSDRIKILAIAFGGTGQDPLVP